MSETSEIKITKVKNVSADEMLTLDEPIYKTLVKKFLAVSILITGNFVYLLTVERCPYDP